MRVDNSWMWSSLKKDKLLFIGAVGACKFKDLINGEEACCSIFFVVRSSLTGTGLFSFPSRRSSFSSLKTNPLVEG